ncbi:2,3-dehydroadipyl-CoA hydratase PaaF [Xenorhabdus kozodoii]|uniref:Bifunctional 3-hydroxacyl-CoA dehydrogenase/acyl-CoA-binding protein n=1 Tax=Xenorhabdus kozodoii TaxID=351676 RepID=A0A2D0LEM7_9GAMM|nr:2,3-dehydroadipyl-CoA hydratase PaaF [Xenorhabdus kozodoii]PHM74073.1 bifunctional 3-hydroxacyl-CoA dehydrogenase/acyl-CoA-binding protein [Xenorhabdus kozodoii]
MSQEWILCHQQQRVRTLTLNRPEVRNALSNDCLEQLVQQLELAEADHGTGAIVITGAAMTGSAHCFAAGADLRELQQQNVATAMTDRRPQLWQRLNNISKPLIAAVNGYALGAGCELALACDLVICGENARFGLPEITLGLMPGAGGTQRLIRSVGKALAYQMVLTGEAIDAQRAQEAGLVSEVCTDALTLERAEQIAQRISEFSPLALRAAKAALKAAQETSLSQGLLAERQHFVALAGTSDRQEGISAFLEKRQPTFKGF